MSDIQSIITEAFERRASITPRSVETHVQEAVHEAINLLDSGKARVAEKKAGQWVVNEWLKKAVLLYFRIEDNGFIKGGYTNYWDKVPSKFADYNSKSFRDGGFGGVLDPVQAAPTIIEDNCFIGARSEVVEGVIVEEGSVISMGVYIGQSTKIYNRETGEVSYGRIPAGSVVVSGNLPSKDGKDSLYCAVIVQQVDAHTPSKVGINELLRDI